MGTTQNQFKVDVLKNLGHNLQLDAWLQYERWKAPIYKPGQQTDTTIAVQFTWYPKLHTNALLIHSCKPWATAEIIRGRLP